MTDGGLAGSFSKNEYCAPSLKATHQMKAEASIFSFIYSFGLQKRRTERPKELVCLVCKRKPDWL